MPNTSDTTQASNSQSATDKLFAERRKEGKLPNHAEFWRACQADGLTASQARAMLNSLPPIVPASSLTNKPTK